MSGVASADYRGGTGNDEYTLLAGTSEVVTMKGGNDVVHAPDEGLEAGDRISGGAGYDDLFVTGPIGRHFVFGDATVTGFEYIAFNGQAKYDITLNDHMVAPGAQLYISAYSSTTVEHARIDGSAVHSGTLKLTGSVGADVLIGGAGDDIVGLDGSGDDRLIGGPGADQFYFNSIAHQHTTVVDFHQGQDIIFTDDFRFSDLHIIDTAKGAQVEIYDGVFAIVKGVTASQLTAADFFFAGHDTTPPTVHTPPPVLDLTDHHLRLV